MSNSLLPLPENIVSAISEVLASDEKKKWIHRAEMLHEKYFSRTLESGEDFIQSSSDALAYLALRVPATYAQIYGALTQIKEVVPSWQPKSVLDIGAGPGTGIWATSEVFPSIEYAVGIDKNQDLLSFGKIIAEKAGMTAIKSLLVKDLRFGLGLEEDETFDLVIIANVLNEFTKDKGEQLIRRAFAHCSGVLLIVEPGTEQGSKLISKVAKEWGKNTTLLAPFIDSSFVEDEDYWIHFSKRFFRPPFQRSIRQKMRESTEMASDFEDAKYSYVALSNLESEIKPYARVVGPVKAQKGFLDVPILTQNGIIIQKVMKRHKEQYNFAKNLHWGDLVQRKELIIYES